MKVVKRANETRSSHIVAIVAFVGAEKFSEIYITLHYIT